MLRLPLTRVQLNVWTADQLMPGALRPGIAFVIDVPAALDAHALARAFQTLVNSDDSLRTTIDATGVEPVAQIAPGLAAPVDIVDASGDPDAFLERWLTARAARPFTLHERLFDAAILRLGPQRTVWYLNQHRLVTDAWSIRLAAGRLAALYGQARTGLLPDRIDLPGYRDCAAEQTPAEPARAGLVERASFYGREARGPVYDTFRLTRAIGPSRSRVLREAAARTGSGGCRADCARPALIASALAAWQRRVGEADTVAIGVNWHNRSDRCSATQGLLQTIVPLILDVDPDEGFDTLLTRVGDELTAAVSHAPFRMPQSLAASALHSLVTDSSICVVEFEGVSASPRQVREDRSNVPVSVELTTTPGGEDALEFSLAADVFTRGAGDRMAGHFMACLDAILERRSEPIRTLDLVGPAERQLLLDWGGECRKDGAWASPFLHRILGHATVRGDAPAVIDRGRVTSYRQLVDDGGALAARLVRLGVGADVPVALAFERSAAAMVSLAGVLMAGGVYVPLDLEWPDDRLAFVIQDAGVRLILCESTAGDRLRALVAGDVPVVPPDVPGPAGPACELAGRSDRQLAYIMYTSGSTGRPKGVAIEDASVTNHADACVRRFALGPGDRVLQFRRPVFDGSIEEIIPTWAAGAALVLRPEAAAADFEALSAFVAAEAITVLELPTSYWHAWVQHLVRSGGRVPASVRLVAVGGEEPSPAALAEWFRLTGGRVRWLNMYGPTETTVTAASFEAREPVAGRVPMGRPLDNVKTYVLDERRRLVPVGLPGELYIGGAGVARGYLNQTSLTAERFVDDPAGGRMYRTGDRVRWREDGLLEYLGRIDAQLKVRGYRVEPGEVERALEAHPAVSHAAVAADAKGRGRLIAYLSLAAPVTDAGLRAHLRALVPDYMVPQVFVRLEALPLTPGGKIDRRALRSIPTDAPAVHPASDVRDPVEAEMAAVWERVLGRRGVGHADSFLELGGHSLMAARLVHEVNQAFGSSLPLSVMFPDATVEGLAGALRDTDARLSRPVWTANETGSLAPLVFFHGDYGGGGFYASRLARLLGPDQPLVVVHPHGLDSCAVPPTIETMAEERLPRVLEALRALGGGPVVVGGYCNGGLVAFESARLLEKAGHDVLSVVMLDATNDNVRFRHLARLVWRRAERRGRPAHETRKRLVRWYDRQRTLEQLAGLDDAPPRFRSLADRVSFVSSGVVRKFRPSAGAVSGSSGGGASPRSRHEALYLAYTDATAAYSAQPLDCDVVLLISEDLPYDAVVRQWEPVARRVAAFHIPGDHREAVTSRLPLVASEIAGVVRQVLAGV